MILHRLLSHIGTIREDSSGSRWEGYREPHPDNIHTVSKLKLSLISEIGRPYGRGRGNVVGAKGDGEHQENMAHHNN